jgi:EAL domain-containing protein (putative c-di-GMP-specific phosphodiesterase class I)
VQQLKIDRSFVHEIETSAYHRALIQAALQVATALNLEVVAEGVETASQARLLAELGCPRAQGFLFARPLEVADMPGYLQHTAHRTAACVTT